MNPLGAEFFIKPWRPKGFFQFESTINVLALSDSFEYLSTVRVKCILFHCRTEIQVSDHLQIEGSTIEPLLHEQ